MGAEVETVEVGGLTLRLHVSGPTMRPHDPTAPALVFVHGIGMSHRSFRRSQAASAVRHRTVAVDLPGFGGVPGAHRRIPIAELADLVVGAVRSRVAGDLVLIGQSMGTQIVTEAARRHPHAVRSVVLVSPVVAAGRRSAVLQALDLARDSLTEGVRMNVVVSTDYVRSVRQYLHALGPMLRYRLEDALPSVRQPVLVVRGGPRPDRPRGLGRTARGRRSPRDPLGAARPAPRPGAPTHRARTAARRVPARPAGGAPAVTEPTAPGPAPTSVGRAAPPDRAPLFHRVWWAVLDWWYAIRWQVRSLGPTTADDYRSGTGQPVVVVPGVYETWHFMRPLMDALHDRGHPVHVLPVLRHNLRPVPDSAREVQGYLEQHDLTDVLIVAHSKGGLIGKYAMTRLDDHGRIDRMVAVSTPFGGSGYARLAPVRHLRDFRSTDPVLAGLARELDANARITSVYGVFDTLIPEGSALDGATNVRVPVGGHFRILADPRTRDAVLAAAE